MCIAHGKPYKIPTIISTGILASQIRETLIKACAQRATYHVQSTRIMCEDHVRHVQHSIVQLRRHSIQQLPSGPFNQCLQLRVDRTIHGFADALDWSAKSENPSGSDYKSSG